MNYCKNIQMLTKRYSFYNNIVDFFICEITLRYTSNNILIINKTNMQFMLNMNKYNIKIHQSYHEKKSR